MKEGIPFTEKCQNVAKAGTVAAIIYDNADAMLSMTMVLTGSPIPAVFTDRKSGLALQDSVVKTVLMDRSYINAMTNTNGGGMPDFTSYGVTPDLRIKPDMTAPGGLIYSRRPGNQ